MQTNKISAKRNSHKALNSGVMLVAVNFLITVVVFLIFCFLSYTINIGKELYYPLSLASMALSCFILGIVAGRVKRQNGLINGIVYSLASGVFFVILSLAVNKLLFDYRVLISVLLIVVSGAAGGVLSVNFKRKIKNKR